MEELILSYLEKFKLEEKFSEHSFRAKKVDLSRLHIFLKTKNAPLNPHTWYAFCSHLKKNYEATSIQRALSTYRQFFIFLDEEKSLPAYAKLEFPQVRKPEKLPKVLSMDEILNILDRSDFFCSLMLEFLYATGCRISECCNIRWKDIDLENQTLRVLGKGRKMRELPFSESLAVKLKKHFSSSESIYVFPSARNKTKAIDPRQARRLLRKTCLSENSLGKHVHPHMIRHSLATHFLDQGANLRFIQEMLGHKSLSTTQKYLKTSKQRLMEVYDRSHPRA